MLLAELTKDNWQLYNQIWNNKSDFITEQNASIWNDQFYGDGNGALEISADDAYL